MNLFKARKPRTLFEYLIAEGGMVRGARVCVFVIAVAAQRAQLEREGGALGGTLDAERLAELSGYSRATAYRDQQAYRELVPQFPNVFDLIDELQLLKREQRQKSIQGVDVTVLFA